MYNAITQTKEKKKKRNFPYVSLPYAVWSTGVFSQRMMQESIPFERHE